MRRLSRSRIHSSYVVRKKQNTSGKPGAKDFLKMPALSYTVKSNTYLCKNPNKTLSKGPVKSKNKQGKRAPSNSYFLTSKSLKSNKKMLKTRKTSKYFLNESAQTLRPNSKRRLNSSFNGKRTISSKRMKSQQPKISKSTRGTRTKKRFKGNGTQLLNKFFIQNLNLSKRSHLKLFKQHLTAGEYKSLGFRAMDESLELETNFFFKYEKQGATESQIQQRVKETVQYKRNSVRQHKKSVHVVDPKKDLLTPMETPRKQESSIPLSLSKLSHKREAITSVNRRLSMPFLYNSNLITNRNKIKYGNSNSFNHAKNRSLLVLKNKGLLDQSELPGFAKEVKFMKHFEFGLFTPKQWIWQKRLFNFKGFYLADKGVHINEVFREKAKRKRKMRRAREQTFFYIKKIKARIPKYRLFMLKPIRHLIKKLDTPINERLVSDEHINKLLSLYFTFVKVRKGRKLQWMLKIKKNTNIWSLFKFSGIPSNVLFLEQNELKVTPASPRLINSLVSKTLLKLIDKEAFLPDFCVDSIFKYKSNYFSIKLSYQQEARHFVIVLSAIVYKDSKYSSFEKDVLILKPKDLAKIVSKLNTFDMLASSFYNAFFCKKELIFLQNTYTLQKDLSSEFKQSSKKLKYKKKIKIADENTFLKRTLELIIKHYFYIEKMPGVKKNTEVKSNRKQQKKFNRSMSQTPNQKKKLKQYSLRKIAVKNNNDHQTDSFKLCLNKSPISKLSKILFSLKSNTFQIVFLYKRLYEFTIVVYKLDLKQSMSFLFKMNLVVDPRVFQSFFYMKRFNFANRERFQLFTKLDKKKSLKKFLKLFTSKIISTFLPVSNMKKLIQCFRIHVYFNSLNLDEPNCYFYVLQLRNFNETWKNFKFENFSESLDKQKSLFSNIIKHLSRHSFCFLYINLNKQMLSKISINWMLIYHLFFDYENKQKFKDLRTQAKPIFTKVEIDKIILEFSSCWPEYLGRLISQSAGFYGVYVGEQTRAVSFEAPKRSIAEFVHWLSEFQFKNLENNFMKMKPKEELILLRKVKGRLLEFFEKSVQISEIKISAGKESRRKKSLLNSSRQRESLLYCKKKSYFLGGKIYKDLSLYFNNESPINDDLLSTSFKDYKKRSTRISYISILNNLKTAFNQKNKFSKYISTNTFNLERSNTRSVIPSSYNLFPPNLISNKLSTSEE